MIGKFKANIPYNHFLLLVYALLLKWPIFITPVRVANNAGAGYLFDHISKFIQSLHIQFFYATNLAYFTLLIIQAVVLNKIAIDQRIFPKSNYLVGMSYVLCTSLFKEWTLLSPAFISVTLLILLLSRLCKLYNNPEPKKMLFNISFLLAISALVYYPSIIFFPTIFMGLSITRPVHFKEWLTVLIGFVTPYYLLSCLLFLFDVKSIVLFPYLKGHLPSFSLSTIEMANVILLTLLIGIGCYFIYQQMRKLLVYSRKTWSLIFLFFLYALVVPLFTAPSSFQFFIVLGTPISFLLAASFNYIDNIWVNRVIHWALVGLAFAESYWRV